MKSLVKLNKFEKSVWYLWPFPYPPRSLNHFCVWYTKLIDNISNISDEDKRILKNICVETWMNLNICAEQKCAEQKCAEQL